MKAATLARTLLAAAVLTNPLVWFAAGLGAAALVLFAIGWWLWEELSKTPPSLLTAERRVFVVPPSWDAAIAQGPVSEDPVPGVPPGGKNQFSSGKTHIFGDELPRPKPVSPTLRDAILAAEKQPTAAQAAAPKVARVKVPSKKTLEAMDTTSLLTLAKQLGVKNVSGRMKPATMAKKIIGHKPLRAKSVTTKRPKRAST